MKKIKNLLTTFFQSSNHPTFKSSVVCIGKLSKIKTPIYFQSSNLPIFKSSNSGQSTVEFVLFILLVISVSFGMLKIFAVSWKHKFEFLSLSKEILNALF